MSQLPVSLEAVGILAGLSRPYSMSQLSSKIIYDSSGNQQTVPAVNISLSLFSNKTFTSPTIIFSSILTGSGTISPDSKTATYIYRANNDGIIVLLSGGNIPFYININATGRISGIPGVDAQNSFDIGRILVYINTSTPVTRSIYVQNGIIPGFLNMLSGRGLLSFTATITSSPQYSNVVNYVY